MLFFSSESLVTMTTIKDGLSGIPAFVGFIFNGSGPSPLSNTINMEDLTEFSVRFYFTVPFSIEINNLIAFFHTYPLVSQTNPSITIRAQLYEAKETSNIFSAIEESLITLTPSL